MIWLDIFLLALIAAALWWRLRQVIGTRHDQERQRPNPFAVPDPAGEADADPDSAPASNVTTLPAAVLDGPMSVAAGLERIARQERGFSESNFLEGARAGYTMVLEAFAAGDSDTLAALLSAQLQARFVAAIEARQQAGQTLETRIVAITDADVVATHFSGEMALLTVAYNSQQIQITRDANGAVVSGDPARPIAVADSWVWQRRLGSDDPNWQLAETR